MTRCCGRAGSTIEVNRSDPFQLRPAEKQAVKQGITLLNERPPPKEGKSQDLTLSAESRSVTTPSSHTLITFWIQAKSLVDFRSLILKYIFLVTMEPEVGDR